MNIMHMVDLKVTETQQLSIPKQHKLRHVGTRGGTITLWFETDTECEQRVDRTIQIVGTKQRPINPEWEYIGTVNDERYYHTWHVYIEPLKGETI